jgi:hypothetical protein
MNRNIIFVIVLAVACFFIGRLSKPDKNEDLNRITQQLDSVRADKKRLQQELILDAVARVKMEEQFKRKIEKSDSMLHVDSLIIRKYARLINKKRTPHEIENTMLGIYLESVR